jgi:hypothetical protein
MKRKVRLRQTSIQGHSCGTPLVRICVRTRLGTWAPLRFIVDTGATLTNVPIPLARKEGIAFDRSLVAQGTARGLVGAVERFRGAIHLRIFGEEFHWPCDFLDEAAGATRGYAVLGRAGLIQALKVCITDPFVTIARRLDHLPWWKRLALLLPRPTPEHPADVPL